MSTTVNVVRSDIGTIFRNFQQSRFTYAVKRVSESLWKPTENKK